MANVSRETLNFYKAQWKQEWKWKVEVSHGHNFMANTAELAEYNRGASLPRHVQCN